MRAALAPAGSFSLLRDTAYTCERALGAKYSLPHYQLRLQASYGLSINTGRRLRRLFGPGNVTVCRGALEPWTLRAMY